jgi:hypothetical protein
MEVYAVQVITALFIAMIGLFVKSLREDIKLLQAELKNTLTKEEVKEQIKLTQEPLRVEIEHISKDIAEMKLMLMRVLDEKG